MFTHYEKPFPFLYWVNNTVWRPCSDVFPVQYKFHSGVGNMIKHLLRVMWHLWSPLPQWVFMPHELFNIWPIMHSLPINETILIISPFSSHSPATKQNQSVSAYSLCLDQEKKKRTSWALVLFPLFLKCWSSPLLKKKIIRWSIRYINKGSLSCKEGGRLFFVFHREEIGL